MALRSTNPNGGPLLDWLHSPDSGPENGEEDGNDGLTTLVVQAVIALAENPSLSPELRKPCLAKKSLPEA